MFFICKNDKVSEGLARKFSEQAEPGGIIPLTNEEMEAYKDFQVVSTMDSESNLVEIKPDTMYLMMANSNTTNLDDCLKLVKTAEKINSKIRIVRTL